MNKQQQRRGRPYLTPPFAILAHPRRGRGRPRMEHGETDLRRDLLRAFPSLLQCGSQKMAVNRTEGGLAMPDAAELDLLIQREYEEFAALALRKQRFADDERAALLYADLAMIYKRLLALESDARLCMRQIVQITRRHDLIAPREDERAASTIQQHHARDRAQPNGKYLNKPTL